MLMTQISFRFAILTDFSSRGYTEGHLTIGNGKMNCHISFYNYIFEHTVFEMEDLTFGLRLPYKEPPKDVRDRFEKILESTFPVASEREAFLDAIADMLKGKITDVVFSGGFSTGKTVIESIVTAAFGEYATRISCESRRFPGS